MGADGSFTFSTTRMQPYTVPYNGPAGGMLRALGRDAWRPAHLHVITEAEECRPLVTELFLQDGPWLDRDAVFGVRSDLVVPLGRMAKAETPARLLARGRLPEKVLHAPLAIRMARG